VCSSDLAHERQLERDGEVFPFKQRAYEDILTFFESWNFWMEWTEPWFSEHSPDALKEMLPDLPAPKEQVNMLARLALFSSDEVYELAKRQTRRIQAFDRAVKTLRTMREGLKDGAEHWQKVEERRADARASHEELAAAMREELGSTAPRPVAELLPGRTTE